MEIPRDAQRDGAPHQRQKVSVLKDTRIVGRSCAYPTDPCQLALRRARSVLTSDALAFPFALRALISARPANQQKACEGREERVPRRRTEENLLRPMDVSWLRFGYAVSRFRAA